MPPFVVWDKGVITCVWNMHFAPTTGTRSRICGFAENHCLQRIWCFQIIQHSKTQGRLIQATWISNGPTKHRQWGFMVCAAKHTQQNIKRPSCMQFGESTSSLYYNLEHLINKDTKATCNVTLQNSQHSLRSWVFHQPCTSIHRMHKHDKSTVELSSNFSVGVVF